MPKDLYCDWCGKKIPRTASSIKNARRHRFHHCNRACDVARRKQINFYKRISVTGHDARVVAVTKSNHDNPRRKRSKQ